MRPSTRSLFALAAVAAGLAACGHAPTAPAVTSAPPTPPATPAAAAAAVSPALPATPAAAPPAPVLTDWRIVQARSEPMLDFRRARLEFQPGGQLVGHTTCNAMSATYTLKGDQLKIGPVATTRMACSRLLLEQEDRILTALELAATARVRPDGLLELRDAEGRGVLRAVRADLPE